MKVQQETGQVLELVEGPGKSQFWQIGLSLWLLAVVVIPALLLNRPLTVSDWLVLIAAILLLVWNIFTLSIRRVVFDRTRGELTIQNRFLLLRRVTTQVVPLSDLQGVIVQTTDLSWGRKSHLLKLEIQNGQQSNLEFQGGAGAARQALATRINAFLGVT